MKSFSFDNRFVKIKWQKLRDVFICNELLNTTTTNYLIRNFGYQQNVVLNTYLDKITFEVADYSVLCKRSGCVVYDSLKVNNRRAA